MKKTLRFLPFLLVALMAVTLWSCDDDDDDVKITEQQLPSQAKQFLTQYYPTYNVRKVTKDDKEYEVVLSNNHKVDFDLAGEWTDVDAPKGQTIPNGFYPADIDIYLDENLNGTGINEISKEIYGYDVELINGRDLRFSQTGAFLGYDY